MNLSINNLIMDPEKLSKKIVTTLDKHKALDIEVIDVRHLTTITDIMIFASGRSSRQVKALAEKIIEMAKKAKVPPLGIEGVQEAEWILVDLGDVIVHVMKPTTRAYYQLEKLWTKEHQHKANEANSGL